MKKIWGLLVLIMFFPVFVYAKDQYITYTDILVNGNPIQSWFYDNDGNKTCVNYNMMNKTNYSFKLTGYDLVSEETYTFLMKSDFKNFSEQYTGAQLMEGVIISFDDGDSRIQAMLKDNSENAIKIKDLDSFYDEAYFYFNENFDSTALDTFYNKIAPEGKIKINTIEPDNEDFYETAISTALSEYVTEEYNVYGGCYDEFSDGNYVCSISIQDYNSGKFKHYPAEFIYVETDELVKEKVSNYAKNFDFKQEDIEKQLFTIEDMEAINFKIASINYNDDIRMINSIINYSSEFQKKLENGNITALLDSRAGWDDQFTSGGFGFLNLVYDKVIYGFAPLAGVKQNNVIYVPNDTKDTRKDYIDAAISRIKEYIPNVKVSIEYAGEINTLNFDDAILKLEDIVDVTKTLGEYYKINLNGKDFYFFIAKDSSKMRKPIMITNDLLTNISIVTDEPNVPLDTKVNAVLFDKNSKIYKEYINRLSLKDAKVVDLKLYSDSVGSYIEKLDNGKFKVYIPVDDEFSKKDLVAYYVTSDGKVEKHPVKIENGFAVFETNHFSTYTIGYEEGISNPQTLDNIYVIAGGLIVSLALIFGIVIILKKQKNK